MQSTNEIVEEAKKKRTLASLKPTVLPENQYTIKTELLDSHDNGFNIKQEENSSVNTVLPENHITRNKVKVTVYIYEESWDDFNKIYGTRIANKRKTDKGELMMEAIELLKQNENKS